MSQVVDEALAVLLVGMQEAARQVEGLRCKRLSALRFQPPIGVVENGVSRIDGGADPVWHESCNIFCPSAPWDRTRRPAPSRIVHNFVIFSPHKRNKLFVLLSYSSSMMVTSADDDGRVGPSPSRAGGRSRPGASVRRDARHGGSRDMEGDLDTQLNKLYKVGITRCNAVHRSRGSSVMFRQR